MLGIEVLLNAIFKYVIKYIFLGFVAFGGIMLGKFLRKKKDNKKA